MRQLYCNSGTAVHAHHEHMYRGETFLCPGVKVEPNKPEPDPTPNDRPAVWDLVIADMNERNRIGTEKYGTPLQAHNGRDALVDAYQELLDLVVYLRQEIEEKKHREILVQLCQNIFAAWSVRVKGTPLADKLAEIQDLARIIEHGEKKV